MSPNSLLALALIGLLLALPLLLYAGRSAGLDKHMRLAGLTAFLALDLIMFGGFTRLTDSGLGCPDWPGCYGHSNPIAAGEPIRVAENALPDGPVTWVKAWIEMLHRYVAMALGVLIITLAVQAWRRWRARAGGAPWLALVILAWICVQGAFGAFTVTMKLQPLVVTLHLLGGMILLALLTWLALSLRGSHLGSVTPDRGLGLHAGLALLLLGLQIALGGWVSSNYAVLACPDVPLCQGRWLPQMEFGHAFTLWRPLGMTGDGGFMPSESLVAIHWLHRLGAVLVSIMLGSLVWRVRRSPSLKRWAALFALLLGMQILTGLGTVVFRWPLPLALLHNGGAALLVMTLVWLLRRGRAV